MLSVVILLKYNFELLILYSSISIFCYFIHSFQIERQDLYFLLHYICFVTVVTLQIQIGNTKYNQHIIYQIHWNMFMYL